MKRSITRWTTAATAAALLAIPVTGAAQTTGTSTPATQSPTSAAPSQDAPEAAREHLRQAKSSLDEVQTTSLDAKARTQVTELKKRLTALERAIGANDSASATGQANRNPRATANRGNSNWGTEVAAIDKALTTLLGPASTTGATGTTMPAPTGTSGSAASSAGVTLDETSRAKLSEVRTHITAFATAMAGGRTTAEPTASTSAAGAGATAGTTGTTTSGTSGTSATTGTSGAAAGAATSPTQPTQTDPQMQTPSSSQVDEDAARRHLTEARNTLSEMTQLPAAAQLQGEARTHITQLISNFNELITTQTEWRATYAKLDANMTALIGPDPDAAGATAGTAAGATTGTAGATGTTGTTGATGATAGTSGTAAAELDPAVREKLQELRRHLNAFEKAAGGSAAGSSASTPAGDPSTTGTSPMTSGSSAAAGTTGAAGTSTAGTSATGTSATGATTTTGTSGTAATTPQQTGTAQADNADLMRHVAAIEAMLKMQDDSGGLTLTRTQVEQLRTHWAALRAAVERR